MSINRLACICSFIMQITLTTKSSGAVESLSPTLSLLQGSESWMVLYKDGRIEVSSLIELRDCSNVNVRAA